MSGAFPPVPPRRRVLVVDDSTFMRIALRRIIESEGMTVVGEARNGREAVELARDLKPDIITMDVEMPELDGLGAMKLIIAERRPAPIMIMVSGHTQRGTEATIKALSLGAVDFVSKSSSFAAEDLGHVDSELKEKLRYWASQPAPLPHSPAGQPGRPAGARRCTDRPPGPCCGRSRRAARSTWWSSPARPAARRCWRASSPAPHRSARR